jgi:Xaa-Pro aminopeptidase
MQRICIPDYEYLQRVEKAAALAGQWGLDVLLVNSTESDYANVRYFSGYWPLFERAGVAIVPSGRAAIMVGPESTKYAADVSRVESVYNTLYYRESANPSYPETQTSTYRDVFRALGVAGERIRVGVCSLLDTTVVMMEGLRECYPQAEIVDAFDIMASLRSIKSANELACLREGFRITSLAMDEVRKSLRPGVTELQMVGVAQRVIYENGAEYEGLPMYVFSEKSTSHAISRPSYRNILKGDIVQLNLSAKVDGYSPSIGYPVCMGKLTDEKRDIVEFGLEAHRWTETRLRGGAAAAKIASDFYGMFCERGYKENFAYGPCHGIGMIEVEAPWMETSSNYALQPNMTFQIDTFVSGSTFGIRWEKGIVVTADGFECLSQPIGEIYELDA